MQLTINISDMLPNEKALLLIAELEQLFVKKGISCKIEKTAAYDDPWDSLDIDEIAVDTGIEDFAENHDHYLYGTAKRS
ncbi:MAG: hypothetical protein V2I97_20570 [Desulfococcaceae bacterium]|jgi:hypothetical protein|nr:hypothetical protein [Desulfococcaceae bacterium]